MARRVALFVPLPMIKSPVVVIGERALNAAAAVVCPVPPLAMASVPASVTAPVVAVEGVKPVLPPLNEATVLEVVANVPLVGKVTDVVPVTVNVVLNAPENVRAPPNATALPPILPTVVANEPAVFVTSPVNAGTAAVGKVDAAAAVPAVPVPT